MWIEPYADYILLSPIQTSRWTDGGIYKPPSVDSVTTYGHVLAVGPGFYNKKGKFFPTILTAGCIVGFNKYVGYRWNHLGEDLILIKESAILFYYAPYFNLPI